MRTVYRVLAYLIALEVAVQAAVMVFAIAGLGVWVDDGGVLDKAAMESEDLSFTGAVGFMLHGLNGSMIIPVIALIFLIFSFFAKVPGGAKWAAFVFLAVAIQVLLGMFAHEIPQLGILHGLNALILFTTAFLAGRRVPAATAARGEATQVATTPGEGAYTPQP